MKTLIYQVEYSATYWVVAESEQQAIELAIEEHNDMPNGDWEAYIDPYDSNNFNTLGEK
jgi:hypothetical protein